MGLACVAVVSAIAFVLTYRDAAVRRVATASAATVLSTSLDTSIGLVAALAVDKEVLGAAVASLTAIVAVGSGGGDGPRAEAGGWTAPRPSSEPIRGCWTWCYLRAPSCSALVAWVSPLQALVAKSGATGVQLDT